MRHGTHQEAKKFTTTTWPCKPAEATFPPPSSAGRSKDGDGLSIARRVFDEENAAPRYHYGPREVARPFGRLRSASTLPRWGSRVCAKIKTVKVVFATDRNVVDLDALPYNQSAWERSPTVAVFDVSPILGNIDDLIAQGALPT